MHSVTVLSLCSSYYPIYATLFRKEKKKSKAILKKSAVSCTAGYRKPCSNCSWTPKSFLFSSNTLLLAQEVLHLPVFGISNLLLQEHRLAKELPISSKNDIARVRVRTLSMTQSSYCRCSVTVEVTVIWTTLNTASNHTKNSFTLQTESSLKAFLFNWRLHFFCVCIESTMHFHILSFREYPHIAR